MNIRNERMNMKSHLKQEQTLLEVSLSIFSMSFLFFFCSPKGSFQVVELLLVTKVK
jgi:hypothetical protein